MKTKNIPVIFQIHKIEFWIYIQFVKDKKIDSA